MMPTPLRVLHRRLAAAMALAALAAFVSGAGLETPTPLLAAAALTLSLMWAPPARLQRLLDPVWRALALALAARALYRIVVSPDDVVIPMVDLLLVLLVSENLKESGAAGDTRVYSLSFALLVASCAYRPGIVFAVSFVAYTALATVTLTVGHLIRKLNEHNERDVGLEPGFLVRIASMSGIMLTLSAVVFVAFPRVSRGWATRGQTQTSSVVGFSDRVSLAEHGSRIYPNPEVVLRVEFPDGPPNNTRALYWRGRSYDFFDGVAWARSSSVPMVSPPSAFYAARWPGVRTVQRIFEVPLEIPILFGVHPVLNVVPHSRMRAMQDTFGDLLYFGAGAPMYDVVSAGERPSADALRSAQGRELFGAGYFLQVPSLSRRVKLLADSLTAGAPTRFDKVMAVQNWLHREFRYTLELPATPREATLENFLFRRRAGHCEYFSTALAILLREVGIPARNVNGFLGGAWNEFGNFLTVTQNEAHSWVEVWFPGYGWVPFDGTPAATADAAGEGRNWLGPFKTVFDGLEHRWNKWILEYDLEAQVSLFRRATEQFARRDDTGEWKWNPGAVRLFKWGIIAATLLVLLVMIFSRGLPTEVSGASRTYLKLRRAYEKYGYGHSRQPPMQFLDGLEKKSAPGHEAARRAVELYLKSRFSGGDIGDAERSAMSAASIQAISAVRRAGRSSSAASETRRAKAS